MARSKPQTEFHISYGAVTLTNNADALLPVLIAPRYAVHSSIYGNADTGITYSGAAISVNWPNKTADSVIDQIGARVVVTNPTIELTASSATSAAPNGVIKFGGAVTGSDTVFQNDYAIRPGDIIQVTSGGSDYAYTVASIGQSVDSGNATLIGGSSMGATVEYTGTTSAVYAITALNAASGGSVTILAVGAIGDPGYSATVTLATGQTANIGTLGATITPTTLASGTITSGEAMVLSCAGGSAGEYDTVYVEEAGVPVISGATVVLTSNFITSGSAPILNNYWSAGSSIAISSGAQCTYGGSTYPIVEGGIEVDYRELLTDDVNVLMTGAEASSWVGQLTPENPLGEAYKAAIQTGTNDFFVIAAANDTDDAYEAALSVVTNNEAVYSLVPLRQTPAVVTAMTGVIAESSKPTVAKMKKGWVYSQIKPETLIGVTLGGKSSASDLLVHVDDVTLADSLIVGDTIIFQNVSTGAGFVDKSAKIVENPADGTGIFKIDTQLGVIPTTSILIVRKLNHTQLAQAIAAEARRLNNSRINYVYAEPCTVAGDSFEDAQYILPVLATMRGTMAPHAPLTDVPIPGVSISTGIGFTEADLDLMNDAGVWICYRDGRGQMVTRHAVTTGGEGTIAEEDSAVSNGDNIVRTVRNQVSWLRGNCNVTPALIDKIYVTVQAAFAAIQGRNYDALIGPQILEVKTISVKQDPNNTAGVIGQFDLDLPDVYLNGDFTFNLF